jgi:hypothetical protein
MRSVGASIPLTVFALAAMFVSAHLHAAQTPDFQQAQPSSQTPSTEKPKKKPAEPIDPDTTAGVRGPTSPLTIQVKLRNKSIAGAQVLVRNTNGTLAASCVTNDWGDCKVEVGADNYMILATAKKLSGTMSVGVTDSTNQVVIQLSKAK